MRIAIPLAEGVLSMHFGHCEEFALVDVNRDSKEIESIAKVEAPPHQPGLLPKWLADKGANLIIAGGMGMRAKNLFDQNGIEVVVGAPSLPPEAIVIEYMAGTLSTGENLCDH